MQRLPPPQHDQADPGRLVYATAMSLRNEPPRRFAKRSVPMYPTVFTATAVLAAASACHPAAATNPGSDVVVASTPLQSSAESNPGNAPPQRSSHTSEDGERDARTASRFTADDASLDLQIGCKGDCPSPFQIASSHKDEQQVADRADFCLRAAHARGPVPEFRFTLRGLVGKDGKIRTTSLENVDAGPPSDVAACVQALVATARFTAPDQSEERVLYVTVQPHK